MELDRRMRPSYRFRLAYRPPYDWDAVTAFLGARATPGVERVESGRYQRTIAIGGKSGTVTVSTRSKGSSLLLEVLIDSPRSLPAIVERVRRMFDIDANPAAIAKQLGGDALLKRPLGAHPGIRTPGAWDPFELSVRAILGQQISVAAATTIAGRVAQRWGSPMEGTALCRLFPTPAQLADAPLEEAGIISARAETLRALSRAVRDKAVRFDGVATIPALRAIPGIGDWTAQYIAMRALNQPDAFPSADLVLRRMAGGRSARQLAQRAEDWRPWRSYAVMLLWQAARDLDEKRRKVRPAR